MDALKLNFVRANYDYSYSAVHAKSTLALTFTCQEHRDRQKCHQLSTIALD